MADYFEQADREIAQAIQKGLNIKVDGFIGNQTILNIALQFESQGIIKLNYPLALEIYDGYMIIGQKDQVNFDYAQYKRKCSDYKYATNGTFFDYSTNKLVSILADQEKIYHNMGSKVWRDKAEGCIWLDYKGKLHYNRIKYINELKDVKWAISGVTLHDYHPKWEGFVGKFSDVLRHTWHSVLGIDYDDRVILFHKKASARKLVEDVNDNLKLKYAILLDGGSMAAINTPKFSRNKYQSQNNIIYFKA